MSDNTVKPWIEVSPLVHCRPLLTEGGRFYPGFDGRLYSYPDIGAGEVSTFHYGRNDLQQLLNVTSNE